MTEIYLKDPLENSNISDDRLRLYEKGLREFTAKVIEEDKQTSSHQTAKLKQYIHSLKEIKDKTRTIRIETEKKTIKVNQEIAELQQKLGGFQNISNDVSEDDYKAKIRQEQQKHINNCKKRIEIAESINIKNWAKLEIQERKSSAHEVFKWVLVALYAEPDSKYYWPNFKDQAIEETEGREDFKQRLGRINALNAKEQQRVKTAKFVEIYEEHVKNSEEFKEFTQQIDKIYAIAKLFLSSIEIGRKIRGYQKNIVEVRRHIQRMDDEHLQFKKQYDALLQQRKVSQEYLKQLAKIESVLGSKLAKYQEQASLAENYTKDLSNVTISTFIQEKQVEGIPPERSQCECRIY